MVLIWSLVLGCVAKSSVVLLQTNIAIKEAEESGVDRSTYAWTMASSYKIKAWEEYANADYEDAEIYASECNKWILVAKEKMTSNPDNEPIETIEVTEDAVLESPQ